MVLFVLFLALYIVLNFVLDYVFDSTIKDGCLLEIYCASRSAAFHPKAVCGHFGNPALASR